MWPAAPAGPLSLFWKKLVFQVKIQLRIRPLGVGCSGRPGGPCTRPRCSSPLPIPRACNPSGATRPGAPLSPGAEPAFACRGSMVFCGSGAADELGPGGGQLESHVPVLPPGPRDDLVYVRSSKPRPPCLFTPGGRGTSLRPPRGDWAGSGKMVKLVQAGRVGRGRWRRRPKPPWAPTSSCWA